MDTDPLCVVEWLSPSRRRAAHAPRVAQAVWKLNVTTTRCNTRYLRRPSSSNDPPQDCHLPPACWPPWPDSFSISRYLVLDMFSFAHFTSPSFIHPVYSVARKRTSPYTVHTLPLRWWLCLTASSSPVATPPQLVSELAILHTLPRSSPFAPLLCCYPKSIH